LYFEVRPLGVEHEVVIARGAVGERAVRRGVASDCIVAAVLAPDPGESVHA
jgi:hypothetical protein